MRAHGIIQPPRASRRRHMLGFTIVETMLALVIVGLLATIAIPIYQGATVKAQRVALASDMTELYSAFMRYNFDHGRFPTDAGAGTFNTTTLSPLSSEGYFRGTSSLTRKLENRRMLFYWAPDWNGSDADFMVIATSAAEPSVYVYAMHYDFGGGVAYDGVYLLINGQLVRADGST